MKAPGLFHIGPQDGEEFLGRLGTRGTIRLALEEVAAQMMFNQFVGQAANGATDRGDEMHDLSAAGLGQQGALDRVHLPTQATDTGQELGLVVESVGHNGPSNRVGGIP